MSKKIKSHNFNNIDGKRVYIAITLTNDKEIHELNKKYLKRNYPTDVLSFNMDKNMEDGTYYLGGVIITILKEEKTDEDGYTYSFRYGS